MHHLRSGFLLFCCLLSLVAGGAGCRSETNSRAADSYAQAPQVRGQGEKRADQSQSSFRNKGSVPPYVYEVLAYVRANNRPMPGYVGGRRFGNFEKHLPRSGTNGEPIRYQEWDVNPKTRGRNRGTERLITGSDQRDWYTNDHYNTFTELTP